MKRESEYDMFDWWKKVFVDNYANFDGRARRAEYWYFTLVNVIAAFLGAILLVAVGVSSDTNQAPLGFVVGIIIYVLMYLVLLIPSIAVAVRRLHDTGKSGWWYLIRFIPIVGGIGSIVLLVFYCMEGDRGRNEFGSDPKAPESYEIDEIGIS